MGMFSFLKNAGEKLFGGGSSNEDKAAAIKANLEKYKLPTNGLQIVVDGDKVTVTGDVATQETKNRILATAGNVEGIAQVEDHINVVDTSTTIPDITKAFYTVKSGDTLWKISETTLGDGNKYPIIFEANKPMLTDPDKIYPGQVLVIPQNA